MVLGQLVTQATLEDLEELGTQCNQTISDKEKQIIERKSTYGSIQHLTHNKKFSHLGFSTQQLALTETFWQIMQMKPVTCVRYYIITKNM